MTEFSYLRNAFPDRRMTLRPEGDPEVLAMAVSLFGGTANQLRLTPDRLVAIVGDADAGDPREQAILFSSILEKEPIVAAHLQTRRLAVRACPWKIEASKGGAPLAGDIEDELRDAGLDGAIAHLLDCIGTGYAGCVVDWKSGGAGIRGFVPVTPDAWTFDEAGNPAITTVSGKETPLAAYHPAQVLYLVNDGKAGLPCRRGVMRTILWMHLFKYSAFRDWGVFLERFGVPFILGKIPSGDFSDPRKRKELLDGIMGIRSGGVGVGTTETDMQILNGTSGSSQQAYEQYQRYCDEIMTIVILGQRASSDAAGGLSKGTAQDAVRQDILQADASMVERAVQPLVDWLCTLKYGKDPAGLRFRIDSSKPEDMNIRADRDLKLAQASGLRLDRKYVMDTYGIVLEEQPQPQPAATAGFSDAPQDRSLASRMADATVRRLIDEDAFAAWRFSIDNAIRRAFGDIDPDDPDVVAKVSERAPAFLQSLPGVLDGIPVEAFVAALQDGILTTSLNTLGPNFQPSGGTAK